MHAPNHPDDRAWQLVTQDDTGFWLFTVSAESVWCQLGLGN